MARRREKSSNDAQEKVVRHPLLVYYNLGKRYRSPGILFILLGMLSFLPFFIEDLENDLIDPNTAAGVGAVLILVGLAFVLFARLAMRRSYVQCMPDLMLVRTPFYSALVSYRRIKQSQSVQVSQIYPKESLKGIGKPLMRPLLAMTAVEVLVSSWPVPKKKLQRYLSKYLFSARSEAWLFIVPNYAALNRQLDSAIGRQMDERKGTSSGYLDPFERLKLQQK
ncbi:MAG TPA: hypothetical protein VHP83_26445 [Aggregatilineaceae bacterium]|nr:hypothetical protein [Aggregatilineaceae bacterium]